MSAGKELRTVVVEREMAHPPEKIWRALTQSHLIGEWLMKTEFKAEPGYAFNFAEEWGTIACKVEEVEPNRRLSYTWSAFGLESVVTWTLTPIAGGTNLRVEQEGFTADMDFAFEGAKQAWPGYFTRMEGVLAGI